MFGNGYYEGFLAKTDLYGNMLWQRRYVINPSGYHYIYDVFATNDGGYILGGSCFITTSDAWLLKVDSMGCEVAGCDAVGLTEPLNENTFSVFPNPTSDAVTFQFSSEIQSRTLIIYDASGKEVRREETNQASLTISVREYAEGIYFYMIADSESSIISGKFIIEH